MMPPKDRRLREREETRSKIIDAAREMFASDGVEAVTMRAIADRIEYTPTAIYHHFRDKQALLQELCAQDYGSLARTFVRVGRIEDPVERLRRIGLGYLDFALEHPSHYRFMFMTRKPDGFSGAGDLQRGNPEEDAYAFLRDTVAEGILTGRFRPEFSDAEELAQIMWSGVHGVISLHLAKDNDVWVDWRDTRATARTMIEVLIRGTLKAGK
jgi:AcrR family transcriptional regulator